MIIIIMNNNNNNNDNNSNLQYLHRWQYAWAKDQTAVSVVLY